MKYQYKSIFVFGLIGVIFSCQKEKKQNVNQDENVMSVESINTALYRELESQEVYNWSTASDELLWSAAMQSDSIFSIGYELSAFENIDDKLHQINIESPEWMAVRDQVLNLILEEEQKSDPKKTIEDLLPFGYPETVPSMAVYMSSYSAVQKLREMSEVRYLEPMGYELEPLRDLSVKMTDRSSSGCGSVDPSEYINPADYTSISPGAVQSWHHEPSNVNAAWTGSTGDDVTIVIIDSGISEDQDNFGSNFNSGFSSGRTIERISTLYSGRWWWRSLDGPNDQCGHGTQMAGFAAAPRSTDGNATGVAYNANLIGIRAVEDVFISSSNEKNGVKNALIIAGNRSDVKVVSMSLGTPFYSGTVADGVNYAYLQGKSVFVAAGTSLTWTSGIGVIFPATMSRTIAVTGVKDLSAVRCASCHDGGAVDFTMVMERSVDADRHGLTTALYSNNPTSVGGSSCATASVAGIAALVYSENPGISRDEVYDILKENASNYPVRDSQLGWGTIDANAAVNY